MNSVAEKFNPKMLDFIKRLNEMGVSRLSMARKLGLCHATLTKYMTAAGIQPIFTRTPGGMPCRPFNLERAEKLYRSGLSTRKVARAMGWSSSGIQERLRKAGVQLRPSTKELMRVYRERGLDVSSSKLSERQG